MLPFAAYKGKAASLLAHTHTMRISNQMCLASALAIGCSVMTSAFLMPFPNAKGLARTQVWSAVTDRTPSAVASSSGTVAPVLPGMAEDEADDPNEYFEPEPVDPTLAELEALSSEELAHVLPNSGGKTIQQWLEGDKPTFTDGSLVGNWVKEAQRLRLMPFLERAEHLKAQSFDDLNAFRARQVEWRDMLESKGVLDVYQGMAETGITELSDEAYAAKLAGAREQYTAEMVAHEEALLASVDALCKNARFEGFAADNMVRVVMNGRMEPQEVEVKEGPAFADARLLGLAVEAAMDSAYKQAAEFYEETMATEYLSKAQSPTDVQGIVEALAKKEFSVEEDVVDMF